MTICVSKGCTAEGQEHGFGRGISCSAHPQTCTIETYAFWLRKANIISAGLKTYTPWTMVALFHYSHHSTPAGWMVSMEWATIVQVSGCQTCFNSCRGIVQDKHSRTNILTKQHMRFRAEVGMCVTLARIQTVSHKMCGQKRHA